MKILKLLILLLLVGCEVTFNSDLKEYIDDVSGKTRLSFSLDSSFSIKDEYEETFYYSFEYSSLSKTDTLTFTNNESYGVSIKTYTLDSEDFSIITPYTGKLESGAQFSVVINYDPEVNLNKTVKSDLIITDTKNREYRLVLLGSSKRQPLDIVFKGEVIDKFDFGDKYVESNKAIFTLVNDGLSTLNIDAITVPAGVNIDTTTAFSIPVFGTKDIEMFYENPDSSLSGNIYIQSDFSESNYIEFPAYGGGDLNLQIEETDINGNVLNTVTDYDYNFGLIDPSIDSQSRRYFKITNTSIFEIDITAGGVKGLTSSNGFDIDFSAATLQPGDTLGFEIYASSTLNENIDGYFYIHETKSGRSLQFNVTIQVN